MLRAKQKEHDADIFQLWLVLQARRKEFDAPIFQHRLVLQAKRKEYDAHIFEANEAEAAMVSDACSVVFWSRYVLDVSGYSTQLGGVLCVHRQGSH